MPVAFFHKVSGAADIVSNGISLTDDDGRANSVAYVAPDLKYDFLAIFKGDKTLNLAASTAETVDFKVESKTETPEVIELKRKVEDLSKREWIWGEVIKDYLQQIDKLNNIQRNWFNGAIRRGGGTKGAIGDVKDAK
jgi:hypothetical protein